MFAKTSRSMEHKKIRRQLRLMILLEVVLYVSIVASVALLFYSRFYL